jgi:hypothetical protein
MNYELVIKVGAVIASIGTIFLVIFAIVLLDFSITKLCDNEHKCIYISNAPYPLNLLITPIVLVIILVVIASGIAIIRSGKWFFSKKKLYDKQ